MSLLKNIKFDLIFLVLFIIYTVSTLLLFTNKNEVLWISYLFTIVSFILVLIIFYYYNNKSKIFNLLPLYIISILYLSLQIIISIVFMCLNATLNLNVVIVIETILLGIFIIIALLLIFSKDYIESVEQDTFKKTIFLDNVKKQLEILLNESDDEFKKNIEELINISRYSNPSSDEKVISLEKEFLSLLTQLKIEVENGNNNNIIVICEKLKIILKERDILLKK